MPTGVEVAPVLLGIVSGVVGALAGWALRVLLGRLRRGVIVRPGVLETSAAVVTAAGVAVSWPGPTVLLVVWTGLLAVGLSAVDLVHHRLPDALTLPAIPITAAVLAVTELAFPGTGSLLAAGVVAAALTGVFWLVAVLAPRAMGLGDVKLMPSLGLAVGYLSVTSALLTVALSFVLGAAAAVVGLLTRRLTMTSAIPFGPCLLIGAWLVLAFPGMVTAVP